jgi:AcrR family transcriptional regulator
VPDVDDAIRRARAEYREAGVSGECRGAEQVPVVAKPTVRERLATTAFALFDERGYEQATVDDITERAGVGQSAGS